MKQILLVDDDVKLAQPLTEYFSQFDFQLSSETFPLKALERLRHETFDLVILDVMLPEIDGFETCRRLRQFSDIPVLMLTARGDVMDRVVGLEIGADDYLPKPFEPRELVARMQNILKRGRVESTGKAMQFDGLVIDYYAQEVTVLGIPVKLTASEFLLLQIMSDEPKRVFSRDDIMKVISGIDADIYSRAIDVLVSRLRRKLKPLNAIKTLRSRGYQFILPRVR